MKKVDRDALERLHPVAREWAREKLTRTVDPWKGLFGIQREAIEALTPKTGDLRDIVIAAPTAGGKTVAAFLPLLSRARTDTEADGEVPDANWHSFRILYLSPLIALLNQMRSDTHDIMTLHACAGLRAAAWYSHMKDSEKDEQTDPERLGDRIGFGTFMTTPESLEARLVREPRRFAQLLARVDTVVVDELHVYFDTARGRHLMALLNRLAALLRGVRGDGGPFGARQFRRVALSATLGDRRAGGRIAAVARQRVGGFLRPDLVGTNLETIDASIREISDTDEASHRAGDEKRFEFTLDVSDGTKAEQEDAIVSTLAEMNRRLLASELANRNSTLIFTNSRHDAERYSQALRGASGDAPLIAVDLPPSWLEVDDHRKALDKARSYLGEGFLGRDERPTLGDFERALEGVTALLAEREAEVAPAVTEDAPDEADAAGDENAPRAKARAAVPNANLKRAKAALERILDRNLYWLHHGSLPPASRNEAEKRMRDENLPCAVVCTTTLEHGIDVGLVDNVVQIDPAPTVTALRQRLGRSRRQAYASGDPEKPKLDILVAEPSAPEEDVESATSPLLHLRIKTFQSLAEILLLRDRAYETPRDRRLDLSTLAYQIVSIAFQAEAEADGAGPGDGIPVATLRALLWDRGPFRAAPGIALPGGRDVFEEVIRELCAPGKAQLNRIARHGDRILLTDKGREWTKDPSVSSAFLAVREATVRSGADIIGTVPTRTAVGVGDTIILRGRAWRVTARGSNGNLFVRPASHGRAPHFSGDPIPVSGPIVDRMKALYRMEEADLVALAKSKLAPTARALDSLRRGLAAARQLRVPDRLLIGTIVGTYIVPWRGRRHVNGLLALLSGCSIPAVDVGIAVFVPGLGEERLMALVAHRWPEFSRLDAHEKLRGRVTGPLGKFDRPLSPLLWRIDFLSEVSYGCATEIFGLEDEPGQSSSHHTSKSAPGPRQVAAAENRIVDSM